MATSKKPTGLQIDRKGNKIIFSWSKPETYGDGQQLQWFYTAPSKIWQSAIIKLGKSAKNYTVTAPSKYNKITFGVRGNHDQNSKDPGWSDWASKSFDVHPPKKPTVSAAWSAGTPDKTTFTYTAKDEEHYPFDHVEYRTKWIKDYNGKPESYKWTGAVSTSSNKTGTIFNSTETIPAGQSYTRVVQCRSVGAGGASAWAFASHTYAKPNAPVITSTKGTVEDKTKSKITLNLSWTTSAPSSRPIDKITIEYLITAPDAGMSVPTGASWQEADTPAKKGATSWAEEISDTLADDQVLFARIHVVHDTREDWSTPVIALKGKLAAPTSVTITPTQGTHTITVNATNASSVPDSYLAVTYKKGTSNAVMGIIPHGSSTVNMVVPAWTDAVGSVGVRAVVGSYTAQPADSEGVVVYTIAKPQMTSDTEWKGTLAAPTINAVQSDIEGTAIVTWDWSDSNATDAEVSWSDHEDAWDSTDEPETFVVNNSRASRLSVSGLETGIDLYFRVRLMQTVGDDTSYGLYSDTFVINLASAPAVPVLEMSSQVIDPAGEAIASWVYISRDNSMQAHATIAKVDTSTTPWTYTPILQADTEQTAVIRPSDLEWAVGDYQIAVQVQSASGRWSEYSDPVPVTVREPLTCEITDTSLVYDSIPVNPETYTGNPITFDTGDLEKEVVSLDVELLPVQDLHGYDKPWSAGAGKNKVDIASGSITATTNLLSKELSAGTYTFSAYGKRDDNGSWRVLIADQSDVAIAAGNEASGSSITQSRVTFTLTETATLRLKLQFLNSYDTLRYERLQLELGSTATSYEPYSNICPITGHDSVTVTDTGKNLLPTKAYTNIPYNPTAGTAVAPTEKPTQWTDNGDGTFKLTLSSWEQAGFITPPLQAGKYTFTLTTVTAGMRIGVYVINADNTVNRVSIIRNGTAANDLFQFTTTITDKQWFAVYLAGGSGECVIREPQIELGETATSYAPYKSTTTTVTLPHTVYGADVDVTGGESKETWANISSYNGETISEPWLSSMDEYVSGATPTTGAQVTYKLATPTDLQTTPTDVELLTGVNNISADGDMELTIADGIDRGYFLKGMPLTATVIGAGDTGQTILTVKRKADYVILRPDDTELVGHADEVICQHVYTGEAEQTISIDEVQGKLNDGATYYIEATVNDDLGRQAFDRYPNDDPDDYFKVVWDEQAIMPEATAEIINDDYAKLTITKPQDWAEGSVVDIYRITSDRPQKIAEDVEMDDDPVEYVDPFPTLGDNGGYRFVYKTINGDDTLDADDNFAWLDVKAVCNSAEAIIDFNGERIPLPYNLKVSNSWGKDFQETRYLGGHIAGDWTAGVSRSGSIDTVTVPLNDPAVFRSIRRLAQYTELCHVRTLDGSVMTCNVDVDDDFGYDTAGKIQEVKLDFTRVDPVDLDAVPLDDWLVTP